MKSMTLISQALDIGLGKDPRVLALINCVIKNPNDFERARQLERLVAPKAIIQELFGKPFREPDESVNGMIKFAVTEGGLPVGFNFWEPHCMIAGQTGAGKSVLLNWTFGQIIGLGPVVWIFTKAKDTRRLFTFTRDILVENFCNEPRVNLLLPPPFVDPSTWTNAFADIFIQAYGLYDGTKGFLLKMINYLFSKNKIPGIHDLYRLIKAQKYLPISRFARYQESALNRLEGMLSGNLGKVFSPPWVPLEELARRNIIFEIQNLTSEQQVLIVNTLLTWLYYYKLNNDITNYHGVGIDDANLVFDRNFENRPDRGLPIISHLVSTVRKSKIFIIAATQIPHQLGASIHSNTFTKIIFSLANGRDIYSMAQSMGIHEPEQLKYLHKIGQREVVVKFSGRYQEPFLAYIPEVNI